MPESTRMPLRAALDMTVLPLGRLTSSGPFSPTIAGPPGAKSVPTANPGMSASGLKPAAAVTKPPRPPDAVPPGLTRLALEREALVLALPQQHALALQASPLLSDVLCEPLVLFPRRILPSVYDAIVELYHRAGRQPLVAQEAIQMQTIVNLVSAQLGLAWVPDSVRQFQRSGVVYREVGAGRGQSLPWCETSLVWSAQAPSPALQRFIDFVQQQLRGGVGAAQAAKRLG